MTDHEHKFQFEGSTWACFGWEGACGLRAPACFTPREAALTERGKLDYALMEDDRAEAFMATHFMIVKVP